MIKGLRPSLAESGKIKIGGLGDERTSRHGNKFRLPEKYDHFVITTTQREGGRQDGDLIHDQALMTELAREDYADHDGKIRRLPIVLHSDEPELVFPSMYAAYQGRRLACRGDGETATRHILGKDGRRTGETEERECPCHLLNDKEKHCKPHATLHCSIRVPGRAVAGAVHRWRTTSIISIQQMMGSLTQILATVGILQGLPLQLVVSPMRVDPVDGQPSEVYVCHIVLCATSLVEVQAKALELAQLRKSLAQAVGPRNPSHPPGYRAMLQAPGDEPEHEQAEIAAEFHGQQPDAPESLPATPEQLERLRNPAQPPQTPIETTATTVPVIPVVVTGVTGDGVQVAAVDGQVVGIATPQPTRGAQAPAPELGPKDGDPPGQGRRTTCKGGCGKLYYGANLRGGKCPNCRPPEQVPVDAPELDRHCPECGIVSPELGPGQVCSQCAVAGEMKAAHAAANAAPEPPSRPAEPGAPRPDGKAAMTRFQKALLDCVQSTGMTPNAVATAVFKAHPDLPDQPDNWTADLADKAISALPVAS